MKVLILLLFFLSIWFQKKNPEISGGADRCNLFGNSYKSVDTVSFKALIRDIAMPPPYMPDLLYLAHRKIIDTKNFRSDIVFTVDGCEKNFSLPFNGDISNQVFANLGTTHPVAAVITCAVYRYKDIREFIPHINADSVVIAIKVRTADF